MKIYSKEDKNMIDTEIKEIKALNDDAMSLNNLDELLSLLEDRYNLNGLIQQFENALAENGIFKHKYYWYFYDIVDHIEDVTNVVFSQFLVCLRDELETLEEEQKGVHLN